MSNDFFNVLQRLDYNTLLKFKKNFKANALHGSKI